MTERKLELSNGEKQNMERVRASSTFCEAQHRENLENNLSHVDNPQKGEKTTLTMQERNIWKR
jgi:hypothetical protein